MKRVVLLFLLCACIWAQPASIEGVVVHAGTQEVLSGVHVSLVTTSDGTTTAYGAISDRVGRFSIATIEPGTYFFRPEFRGFVHAPPNTGNSMPTITLKSGQRLVDFKIEMTRRAVIVGRVLDEYGDPVHISVEAESIPKNDEWLPGLHTDTDDRGEFRLSGPPGKYLVKAMPDGGEYVAPGGSQIPEIRTDGSSEAVYGPTYYPSATSANRAAVIEATSGRMVTGIEIRLVRQRRLAISGVVSGIPQGSTGTRIELQTEDGEGSRTATASPDGTFSFPRLEPGSYRLLAVHSAGNAQLHSILVGISLDHTDVTNLQLVLERAGDLTGKLEIVGGPDGPPLERRRVWLEAWGASRFGTTRGTSGEVDKDGGFRIANVFPGDFRVRVDPMPENTYLKSVQVDGAPALDGNVILPHGGRGSVVKVTIGSDAAHLTGAILDKDGEQMMNPVVAVFLLPVPDMIWSPDRVVRVGPDGKYSYKGIRPGKYRIFAIEPQRNSGIQMMKALAEKAEEVEIKANDRVTKDLKVIGQEAANVP